MQRQAPGSPRAGAAGADAGAEAAVARRLAALGCPVSGAELSFWFELRAPALQGMLWWLASAPLASLEQSLSEAELGTARARAAAGKPLLRGAELRRAAAALGALGVARPRRAEAPACGPHLRAELSREAERLANSNSLLSAQVRLLAERRDRAEGCAARRAEELLAAQASARDAAESLTAALQQLGRVAAELDQDKLRQGSVAVSGSGSGSGSGSAHSSNDAELHAALTALERELSGHAAADHETAALVDELARAWYAHAQAQVDTAALRAQLHLLLHPDSEACAAREEETPHSVAEHLAEARRVCRMRAQLRPVQLAGRSAGGHRRRADLLAEAAAAREDWLYSLRAASQGAEAAAREEAAMLHEARALVDSSSGAEQPRQERREGQCPSAAAAAPRRAGRAAASDKDEDRENDGGTRGNAPPPACGVKAGAAHEGRLARGVEPLVPEQVRSEAARLAAEVSRLARADALLAALERELAHRLLRLEAAAVPVAADVQDLAQRRAARLR